MAHLWKWMSESGEWTPLPLDGDAFTLGGDGPLRVPDLLSARGSSQALRRVEDPALPGAGAAWTLIVGRGAHVLINGSPASLGLVALADRDEIRLATGRPLFFSTETLARVNPFPTSGTRGFCPRCKQLIDSGTPAVRCPSCGLWHHASDDLPCWTYGPQCAACSQETALDAGFGWTPEEL
jgi:hypothetical protein